MTDPVKDLFGEETDIRQFVSRLKSLTQTAIQAGNAVTGLVEDLCHFIEYCSVPNVDAPPSPVSRETEETPAPLPGSGRTPVPPEFFYSETNPEPNPEPSPTVIQYDTECEGTRYGTFHYL